MRNGWVEIEEGESKLLIPKVEAPEEGEVFYHPEQALARDMSILFYKSYDYEVLDAFGGTGARAVRLAKNGVKVTSNDISDRAVNLIQKNAKLNGVDIDVIHNRAEKTIHSQLWEAIDIDPFGSPVSWVHCGLLNSKKLLAVTATDTAALSGTYPRVARRRYGFHSKRTPNYHEIAVRALAGFVVRQGAVIEVAATPVFAHTYRHYTRVYFELGKGAGRCDQLLDQMGDSNEVGPIWMGNLWKKSLVEKMWKNRESVTMGSKWTLKHLETIKGELEFPQPYFHLHKLCKSMQITSPPMAAVLKAVNGVRTHFTPLGFRTELSETKVKQELKRLTSS
ncbi:MAG: hypothetical protein GOV00_02830 [Candidatus Altiarchaeota archaeon]|nr:hypothetical protein [Candidatus Altiarchaeota archaeon]